MMYGWHDGAGWSAWVAMSFMMVVFWGVIAAAVIVWLRSSGHRLDHDHQLGPAPSQAESGGDEAVRILDQRFARGEIDVDDYTNRRDLLRTRRPANGV